jgi:preprotein translocase subunit SecE
LQKAYYPQRNKVGGFDVSKDNDKNFDSQNATNISETENVSVSKSSDEPVVSKSEKRRRAKEAAIAATEERKAQEALATDEANMTKRARRRAKEAAALEATAATSTKKPSRTITAEEYNTMKARRSAPKKKRNPNQRKGLEDKRSVWARFTAWLRAIKAELKAVTWPPFKGTSKVTGVWSNIGTVVLVVLFFMIVITAFDFGLTAALRELVGIGNK